MRNVTYSATGNGELPTKIVSSRCQYFLLFLVVFTSGFLFTSISNNYEILYIDTRQSAPKWYLKQHDRQGFTIKTEGCTIPFMKPLNTDVKEFVYEPKLTPCDNADKSLLNNNSTHIWVDKAHFNHYNLSEQTELICCYKSFYRPDFVQNIWSRYVDDRVSYNDCKYFNATIDVEDEFVKVNCTVKGKNVYEQLFLFARERTPTDYVDKQNNQSSYNVVILGIDNVSRLNFHRTMPKTVAFLKDNGAVEMLGYNKVGDNSFPNIVPLLTGYKDTEIKYICLPSMKDSTFDECPFIWNWYKAAGYYTAFAEDSAFLGTFNYGYKGFIRTPTDFYTYTFMEEAEKLAGKNKDLNSYLCMNDKRFYQVLLDYVENVISTLKDNKLFGFFWGVSMSHDFLNYPMVMDDAYELLLKRLQSSKYLDKTIVIVISDHGIRWGPIRNTKQGRLEERLPFVFLLTPQSFRDKYSVSYNNLKLNSRRLATPYDVHETLVDLSDLNNILDGTIEFRKKETYAFNRGISLFLPLPTNRTCELAGIEDHWCSCHTGVKISGPSELIKEAANYFIGHLNWLIHEHKECAHLSVDSIEEATEMVAVEKDEDWKEYLLRVKAKPGGGVFEGTLRLAKGNWTISGTASRLNLYGYQSQCVHNPHLKLYCYCSK